MGRRIVIVGGVAAGASAAAKARRTSEEVEIVLFEAGPYISFANCGLPYYVGEEITERQRLFVSTEAQFTKRFNVSVRVNTRVTAVDRRRKTVTFCHADGASERMTWDRLVLATGALGLSPPIDGLDRPNVFTVRTVPDVDAIIKCLEGLAPAEHGAVRAEAAAESPLRAVVIGGGYVGLETAEQLRRRGMKVTVVEMADQLMLSLDREMAEPLRAALVGAGCEVILGDGVKAVVEKDGGAAPPGPRGPVGVRGAALTASGRELPFDLAILAVGVRPNVELAQAAGLTLGETGAIRVDDMQRTSDPTVYAAGDNCEAMHLVLAKPVNIPLAGPANKAGRVAGANAAMDLAGVADDDPARLHFRGVLGTAIVRVVDTVAGVTGLTETQTRTEGVDAEVTYVHGLSRAGYYPGAEPMLLKLLHAPADGRILGAQVVGREGVDRRVDVLAAAITARMTVGDLEQLDLCYAPPFGSARDMVIMGGFAASNTHRGQMPAVTPMRLFEELKGDRPPVVIDDRSPKEFAEGHVEGAINIPVDELRERVGEVPAGRPVVIYCGTGYRSYVGQRLLMNHGRTDVRNVLGGWRLIRQVQAAFKSKL